MAVAESASFQGRPGDKSGNAGGENERPARADQRLSDRLDRRPLSPARLGRVGPVVLVGEVDDGLGVGGSRRKASRSSRSPRRTPPSPRLRQRTRRSGPTPDLVAAEQLVDHRGADPSARSGDEYAHGLQVMTDRVTPHVSNCHHYAVTMARWESGSRERLAEAALRLFATQGFEGTTVAQIAERHA